jgi:serine/threonine protein kinase
MIIEYLEGCDLSSELEQRRLMPYDEAIGYVLQACEALAEAHAAGVIHRDLKPANLFLQVCGDGTRRIKVLDFGVSKSLLDGTPGLGALTKTASLVGSPLYMSPEQLDSAKDVDARTDVWALGVVLYELISGRTPFQGETIPQLVAGVLHDTPPTLAELQIGTPPGLDAVLRRALDKQRRNRYTSVAELAHALAPFAPPQAAGSAARVTRLLSATAAAEGGIPSPLPSAEPSVVAPKAQPGPTPLSWPTHSRERNARRLWAGLFVLLAVLLSVGGYFAYHWSKSAGDRGPAVASEPEASEPAKALLPAKSAPAAAAPPPAASPINEPPMAAERPEPAAAPKPSELPTKDQNNAHPPVERPTPALPNTAERPKPREPERRLEPQRAPQAPATRSNGSAISDFGGRR